MHTFLGIYIDVSVQAWILSHSVWMCCAGSAEVCKVHGLNLPWTTTTVLVVLVCVFALLSAPPPAVHVCYSLWIWESRRVLQHSMATSFSQTTATHILHKRLHTCAFTEPLNPISLSSPMRNTENPINVTVWITAVQSTGSYWVGNQWICQLSCSV